MSGIAVYLKQEKKFLIGVFLFSLLIRSLFFVFFLGKEKRSWVCTDSAEYHSIAVNIAQGKGILKADGEHNFRRLPGYPIFLAIVYKMFGTEDVNKALWVQILLAALIPILSFCLSLVLLPAQILLAKIVAIYSIFHLGYLLHSGMILSDTLFLFFFLIFCIVFFSSFHMFFCTQIIEKTRNLHVFLAGILLGVISLIRPVGHYLLALSILFIFFSNFTFTQKVKNNIVLFLGWFLIVFLWLLRNFLLTGYIFFHTLPGIHFLIYSAAYIDMDVRKCEYSESKQKLLNEWDELIKKEEKIKDKSLSDIEECYIGEKLAFKYIKKHPALFLKHSLIHMFKTTFGLHSSTLLYMASGELPTYDKNTTMWYKIKRFLIPQTESKFLTFVVYLEMFLLLMMILGFLGFGISLFFRKHLLCTMLKVLPFMLLFIVITLAYGAARLRLPIEPFLIKLSFDFWLTLFKKKALHHV